MSGRTKEAGKDGPNVGLESACVHVSQFYHSTRVCSKISWRERERERERGGGGGERWSAQRFPVERERKSIQPTIFKEVLMMSRSCDLD